MRILMYHEVVDGEPAEVHAVSTRQFAAQMAWLGQEGCRVVGLEDLLTTRETGSLPRKSVAITFDDGYQDNYTVAWPVLRALGYKATVFLVSGAVGGTSQWRQGELGRTPMLTWTQVREMARGGVAFGAHTETHASLTTLDPVTVRRELAGSRTRIEDALGQPVVSLSYPYSRSGGTVKEVAAECGYRLACTYRVGYVGPAGGDPLELQRTGILATDALEDFAAKVRGAVSLRAGWYWRRVRARAGGAKRYWERRS